MAQTKTMNEYTKEYVKQNDNTGCVVIIIYKTELANGVKKNIIEMPDDKKEVLETLNQMNIDSFMISLTDIYSNVWYIPIDNIGEIQVY